MAGNDRLPLEGVRILDFTIVLAGPFSTQLLAEWGAEVIRVESTKHFPPLTRGQIARPAKDVVGRQRRAMSGYPDRDPGPRPWNRSARFNSHSRNKLSMTVDLTQSEGQAVLDRLVRISDGLVENNVPVTMDRLGISWERLSAINPQFVMVRQPGFGLSGPYKEHRLYGPQMEALAGHYSIMGYSGADPSLTGNTLVADALAGLGGALAFTMGLHHRWRTGKGILVEVAGLDNFIPYLGDYVLDYTMNGRLWQQQGNRDPAMAPHNVYPCLGEDRWIAIAARDDQEWQALCRVTGDAALAQDPRFADGLSRLRNQEQLDATLAGWTRERDARELMAALQAAGVPAGMVMDERDAYADPHLNERGFWEEVTHPEAGTHRYQGVQWKAERTPNHIRRAAPRLGEDNEYVYKTLLGFSDDEYRRYEKLGHIGMDYDPSIP